MDSALSQFVTSGHTPATDLSAGGTSVSECSISMRMLVSPAEAPGGSFVVP